MIRSSTQTSVIQESPETECTEYQWKYKSEGVYVKNNKDAAHKLSPYDISLPKDEFKFLSYIREWEKDAGFVTPIKWISAIVITIFHIVCVTFCLYVVWYMRFPKWQSSLFAGVVGLMAGFGVTAGAHRYWCHRSYKAKTPLQLILIFCFSIAGQNTIYEWVRDHRVHHKFSETTADPHDANRGFFFAHVGWLMMKKHPDVVNKGRKMDMSDITNDPLIQFHNKYFILFKALLCFILPTVLPVVLWDEEWDMAIFSQPILRYALSLNFTWSVNSFAHLWGNKPYDKHIMPVENVYVSILAIGEGWHNYHHTFPWDYKAAELGNCFNWTTRILDMFASIGWAYDLKVASPSVIQGVTTNRGDGSQVYGK